MSNDNKNTFRIHVGLFLAELICIPAFLFEISRALAGNTLSWAYVVEWPILGVYAIYMWRRMLQEEKGTDKKSVKAQQRSLEVPPDADPDLLAWNEYLAKMHGTHDDNPVTPRD